MTGDPTELLLSALRRKIFPETARAGRSTRAEGTAVCPGTRVFPEYEPNYLYTLIKRRQIKKLDDGSVSSYILLKLNKIYSQGHKSKTGSGVFNTTTRVNALLRYSFRLFLPCLWCPFIDELNTNKVIILILPYRRT